MMSERRVVAGRPAQRPLIELALLIRQEITDAAQADAWRNLAEIEAILGAYDGVMTQLTNEAAPLRTVVRHAALMDLAPDVLQKRARAVLKAEGWEP